VSDELAKLEARWGELRATDMADFSPVELYRALARMPRDVRESLAEWAAVPGRLDLVDELLERLGSDALSFVITRSGCSRFEAAHMLAKDVPEGCISAPETPLPLVAGRAGQVRLKAFLLTAPPGSSVEVPGQGPIRKLPNGAWEAIPLCELPS